MFGDEQNMGLPVDCMPHSLGPSAAESTDTETQIRRQCYWFPKELIYSMHTNGLYIIMSVSFPLGATSVNDIA